MALTKVTGQVINDTTGLVVGVTTVGGGLSATDGFFSGITTITSTTESTSSTTGSLIVSGGVGIAKNLSIGGSVSIGGTLTYEDVTNIDSVGLITARAGVVVGSGITLSKDGDIFATGVTTSTTFSGSGANLTNLPAGQLTGALPAISGANLTGLAAGGAFVKGVVGVTTLTPVGIETSTVTRKDLIGPAGNTSTGAGSSFHGAYMGDGFLSFNTEFSSSSGYYISTFTNALVAGPMQLGTTLTIDGNFTIV
tara:strand:+ start:221 stop:976 length:756 start_codon:yes stop_codon:yes gene_type:complete